MIEANKSDWNEKEKNLAIEVLRKIEQTQREGKYLPWDVFEGLAKAKKNISTELVLVDESKEKIYLIQRPEDDLEPFPNQWHSPGITHTILEETLDHTFDILREREGVDFDDPKFIGFFEVDSSPRGPYVLMVHSAVAKGEQKNPKGKFFAIKDIPWDDLIIFHKEKIIPLALESLGIES